MPRPNKIFTSTVVADGTPELERALAVLLDPGLAHIVEMVVWRSGPDELIAATATGQARVTADGHTPISGDDPLARQDPLAFLGADAERVDPHPPASRNHYPRAAARLWSTFHDRDRAPDIVVIHSDAHHWPERGGHLGEHGSLSVLQSRAPLLLSGPGVSARGRLPRAARTVDVAPTLLALAGLPVPAGLDGQVVGEVTGPGADRVVGLLWDGANASAMEEGARLGTLPNVARLLEGGCLFDGGAIAEFPSVTLVNHASALTGLEPGHHGIVHNAYYDRALDRPVLANDASTWHEACDLFRPGVRTLWELAGDVTTACVNEPVDRGADYSTFALVRMSGSTDGARSLGAALPSAAQDPHASAAYVADNANYAWSSQIDALGLTQMLTLFTDVAPQLTWWNTTLTDTGHHEGGAHSAIATASLRDADHRLGAFLDQLDARGLFSSTAFLLTADHGSVAGDSACQGDWDVALAAAGVRMRDEAYGFLYLG